MTFPRGENHFSKRRSENENYSQYRRLNSESESESKNYSRYKRKDLKSEKKN
jgi:hypothetical protein